MKLLIKNLIIIYLGGLLFLASFAVGQPQRLFWSLILVVVSGGLDLLWTFLKKKIWYVPMSAIISALILSLVFDTATHPWWAVIAAVLTVLGKQLLQFGKARHLINPAAFSMVVISFFAPVVSWWGVAWGNLSLIIVIIFGVYLLYRLKRFTTIVAFICIYLLGYVLLSFSRGLGATLTWPFLVSLVFDGPLLFFATMMLVEPITTDYPEPKDQIFFGALVGFIAPIFSLYSLPLFLNMDPFLVALVIGNLIVGGRIIPKKVVPVTKAA